ncbi:MAG: alpha-amylase family glycosyl hydrolase [Calditrichia bacterium]
MSKNSRLLTLALTKLEKQPIRVHLNPSHRMAFHIQKSARDKYQFDQNLYGLSGNVILADFKAARRFAQQINEKRDTVRNPQVAVKASQINAMGLIDEILHYVVYLYREQIDSRVLKKATQEIDDRFGVEETQKLFADFLELFPPGPVYTGKLSPEVYLNGTTGGRSNRELILEEIVLLWLANENPAFQPFAELFDDNRLREETGYLKVIGFLKNFFEKQPPFGPDQLPLLDMLREPAIAEPHSLSGQLQYIRKKWGLLLGKYFSRLLSSLDMIKEEEKRRFGGGPGPSHVYRFDRGEGENEPERFSEDREWMPKVVLLAKSTYVWLDQLSKKYQRPIVHLDQVPDEELDQMARWGITGIWLIGLWQRSQASQRIKQLCGNPDAEASAYSLYDYVISPKLGGEAAFQNLKARAWQRGIRMAGDMVPNHMGIDSRWVLEHPDWFLSLPEPPFPGYTYNGPNLSGRDDIGIYLEDHYFDRSDAAVTFKWVNFHTGETRYIYHGNDGTSMPWNDTAQLNYLKPEVREAVIQTILAVARRFPIIRFDAAMTLTQKHYQRLWFPEPGTGGDIASRAEHGMTKDEFLKHMPKEFWQEVVERVAQEAPDTLLLAEAFWLMESYFVRTLGMHRVYNSAFMNMLKREENAQYRQSIKNILLFNPEILKRFVNFMNNPDEDTAIAQFGKGDKYFGVCLLLATLPGLPMIGHGQIEGFTEKYGMEYRRAYWDEQPDQELIRRHEREIFPLFHKRYLFAEVKNFLLFDFYSDGGWVNENVFAYYNRHNDEQALVVYNNKFDEAHGWVNRSVPFVMPGSSEPQTRSLAEALGIPNSEEHFLIFRDHISNLEYIWRCSDVHNQGLHFSLGAFIYQCLLDFRVVPADPEGYLWQIWQELNGGGCPSIEAALREKMAGPQYQRLKEALPAEWFARAVENLSEEEAMELKREYHDRIKSYARENNIPEEEINSALGAWNYEWNLFRKLIQPESSFSPAKLVPFAPSPEQTMEQRALFLTLLGWISIRHFPELFLKDAHSADSPWQKYFGDCFEALGFYPPHNLLMADGIRLMLDNRNWWQQIEPDGNTSWFRELLAQELFSTCLGLNEFEGTMWIQKEAADFTFSLLGMAAFFSDTSLLPLAPATILQRGQSRVFYLKKIQALIARAGFQYNDFVELL